MKILYTEEYRGNFKSFNEVYSISANYHKIKKTGYLGSTNLVLRFFIALIAYSLLSFMYLDLIFSKDKTQAIVIIFAVIFVLFTILYIFALLGVFSQYFALKKSLKLNKSNKKNTLTINEEGIKDDTNNICISSKWKNINSVVIGKYSICILTEATIYYVFPISIKDKLLNGITKYNTNKNLKVIEKEIA